MLLYLLLFTGSNISRNSHPGGVVVSAVVYRSQHFQKLSPVVVVVSAVVHMLQYFQELSPRDEVAVSAAVNRF